MQLSLPDHTSAWPAPFKRRYIFHLLFWVMYAVFMLLEIQGYSMKRGFTFSLPPLLIYLAMMALLVYGNTMFLIPMLLKKKRTFAYIAGIIAFIVLYTYFRSLTQQYWDAIIWPEDRMAIQSYFKWNFIYAVWFIIISSMLFFTDKWSEQQQQVKNIEINQLKTELKYLRSQLNPHFLFNGLNTIYGNISIRDQAARNSLLQFSDLLRYSLYEADADFVSLDKEAEHLKNYVGLQQARSSSSLRVELEITIVEHNAPVTPLLFTPFVENAFKFSQRDDDSERFIRIHLLQQPGSIIFRCSNSFGIYDPPKGGIGLANVKRRLELLYPGRHVLNIHQEEHIFYVELILNT